jgi:ribosomal-protein-alanine N-acetyltransferase
MADVSGPICESARLRLRVARPDDAAFMLAIVNQPSWIRGIGDRNVRTLDAAARYIEARMLEPLRKLGFGMYVVELKVTGAAVGLCGLVQRETLPGPDLGFALLSEHEGQGYAVEAARAVLAHARGVLNIGRVLAITTPTNERSARVLEKLGFVLEGRKPVGTEQLNVYAAG